MRIGLIVILLVSFPVCFYAQQVVPYTLDDRDRLISVENEIKSLRNEINARFEAINVKIESQNEKIALQNEKFDIQNEKFDMLFTLIYFVLGGIMGLIGFVLWDRRTFLKPVRDVNNDLIKQNKKLEEALREYAKEQPKLAEILKYHGIL